MIDSLSIPQTSENTETQVAQFLREHSEVEMILPVILGLLVTSRLQLRATNALLVNLAVATIFRQLFLQIKAHGVQSRSNGKVEAAPNHQGTEIMPGCSIIHSVAGRVRLRIAQLKDPVFAKRLERLLNEDDSVIGVRINQAAASIAIQYETQGLSELDLGLRLMSFLAAAQGESIDDHNGR